MTDENEKNSERLFTWTQLYELTRLPPAPKRSVGRPQESAFPRTLLGIYLNPDEKRSLLGIQKNLTPVLGKKPSYGEVLGIISRIYSAILAEGGDDAGQDTPGPMTRNVADAGILLDAMMGQDTADSKSVDTGYSGKWYQPEQTGLEGKRFGVFNRLLESDSLIAFVKDFVAANIRHA